MLFLMMCDVDSDDRAMTCRQVAPVRHGEEFTRHAFLVSGLVDRRMINDTKTTPPTPPGLSRCVTALHEAAEAGMSLDDRRQTTAQILYQE